MTNEKITIAFEGRGAEDVKKAFEGIKSSAGGLGKALQDVTKIAAGFVIGKAITEAPKLFMDAAKAAAEDAASQARLVKAVENTGIAYDEMGDFVANAIQAGQKLAFTDDQTRDSLSILTAQTGDVEEAMKRYALAQDLARGANIDVVTASKLLGKVTDENVNVLARYGIAAHEGMTETELFGEVQKKFGGQAETFAKSVPGMLARFNDFVGELKEQLGYVLLPIMITVASFVVDKLLPAIQKVADIIYNDLVGAFQSVYKVVNEQAIPAVENFIGKLAPDMLNAAENVKNELPKFLDIFLQGLTSIAAPLDNVAQGLTAFVSDVNTLGSLATITGLLYVTSNAFLLLAAAVVVIVGAIGLLTTPKEELSGTLLEIREGLDSLIASDFAQEVRAVFEDAAKVIGDFANKLKTEILPAIQEFGTQFISDILPKIKQFADEMNEGLIKPLLELANTIIMQNVLPVLIVLGIGFVQLFQKLSPLFVDGLLMIKAFLTDALYPFVKFLADNKILMVAVFAALAVAILLALGPVSMTVIGVLAFITLLGALKQQVKEMSDRVIGIWEALPGPIQAALKFLADDIAAKFEGIKQVVKAAFDAFVNIIQFWKAVISGDWARAWDELKQLVANATDIVQGLIKTAFGNLPGLILDVMGSVIDAATKLGNSIIDAVMDALKALPGKMADAGASAAKAFLSSISVAGVSAGDVAGFLGVKGYALGTPYVPNDGLAYLHQGEAVIPANSNPFSGNMDSGRSVNVSIDTVLARDEGEARTAGNDIAWALLKGLEQRGY